MQSSLTTICKRVVITRTSMLLAYTLMYYASSVYFVTLTFTLYYAN